jgi:hypothetical protein
MSTPRETFLQQLRASFERSGCRNRAIGNHIAKVEAMTDDQYAVHRVRLDEMTARAQPDIARLAADLVRKSRR